MNIYLNFHSTHNNEINALNTVIFRLCKSLNTKHQKKIRSKLRSKIASKYLQKFKVKSLYKAIIH